MKYPLAFAPFAATLFRSLLLVLLMTGTVRGQAPFFDRAAACGLPGTGSVVARRLVLDGQGNTVVAGYFTGTVVFGTQQLTSSGGARSDVFVAKYDPSGNC